MSTRMKTTDSLSTRAPRRFRTARWSRLGAALLGLYVGVSAAALRADEPPPPGSVKTTVSAPVTPGAPVPKPAVDKDGFVAESRPAEMKSVEEGLPAPMLVAAAYSFIWLAVLAFVVYTMTRTRRLEQEIADLTKKIASSGKG